MTWRNPHFNYKYKEWFLPWCVKFTSGKKIVFFPTDNLFHKYYLIRSFYSKMEWKGKDNIHYGVEGIVTDGLIYRRNYKI